MESMEKTRSTATSCTTTQKKACVLMRPAAALMRLDLAMDFVGGLEDQEQAAADQDDVAPGDAGAEDREQRSAQRHQRCQREQQPDAENQGERQADLAGALRLFWVAARHQYGNENQIVDAEHDL